MLAAAFALMFASVLVLWTIWASGKEQ